MAAIESICNDKQTAISILETIGNAVLSETQKSALRAVVGFIQSSFYGDTLRMTPEERDARILELETKLRNSMSEEERKAKAAFYYGVPPGQDFNIVILPPGSDCMAREGEAMTNNSGIACNSKAAATAALETIAGTFPRGVTKDALIAVINWIEKNTAPDFTPESEERIKRIYEDLMDEGNQKALEWSAHGGYPPHGARVEVPFLFDKETKAWEPEHGLPRHGRRNIFCLKPTKG